MARSASRAKLTAAQVDSSNHNTCPCAHIWPQHGEMDACYLVWLDQSCAAHAGTNRPPAPSVHQPPSASNPLRSLYPASLLFGQQREPCPWSKATAYSPLRTCQVLLAVLMGEEREGRGDSSQPAGSSACLPASPCQPLRLSLRSAPLPLSQDSQQVSPQNGDLSESPRRSGSSCLVFSGCCERQRGHTFPCTFTELFFLSRAERVTEVFICCMCDILTFIKSHSLSVLSKLLCERWESHYHDYIKHCFAIVISRHVWWKNGKCNLLCLQSVNEASKPLAKCATTTLHETVERLNNYTNSTAFEKNRRLYIIIRWIHYESHYKYQL